MNQKFGTIGVLGRANAGKSTLVNNLVGEHVSIVSSKPQTTRKRILGILTENNYQIIFCDTPGLHQIRNKLDAFMQTEIETTTSGLTACLYLVDSADYKPYEDQLYISKLEPKLKNIPVYCIFNKIDKVPKEKLQELKEIYAKIYNFTDYFYISAKENIGVLELKNFLFSILPDGIHAYDSDYFTTLTEREIVEEVIREVILENFAQEVPHSVAVQVQEFKERENGKTYISATLFLEKENHKKIIIGANGEGIKKIGTISRQRLNEILNRDIYLDLWVKVKPNWRKNSNWVKKLVYYR